MLDNINWRGAAGKTGVAWRGVSLAWGIEPTMATRLALPLSPRRSVFGFVPIGSAPCCSAWGGSRNDFIAP